eukprot:5682208-Alexandrium_andersonii.AAC.1
MIVDGAQDGGVASFAIPAPGLCSTMLGTSDVLSIAQHASSTMSLASGSFIGSLQGVWNHVEDAFDRCL